jgi:hypothetical protein
VRARYQAWLALAALVFGVTTAPHAQAVAPSIGMNGPSLLALGAGGFDVINGHRPAGLVLGEYRFGQQFLYLHPLLGAEVTTEGAFYGYGGFGLDIDFGPHWTLTPNAAVGAFERGSGLRLGSVVEFRTGAELDYHFDNASRLGFAFHHISNAGISQHNPGEEQMALVYALPIGSLFAPK